MAVEQTRPYEAPLYVQLEPGDPGYLDPDQVQLVVDNSGWSKPKRIPYSAFGNGLMVPTPGSTSGGSHIERGRMTGLSNHYVTQDFVVAFADIPVGRQFLHVYRVNDLGGGETVDDLVPIYGVDVTNTGFSFYIKSDEDLTGIIVEYVFL